MELSSLRTLWLVCRVSARTCALPVEHVIETMRALPIAPFASMPHAVLGMSIVRGAALPVVDVALLLGARAASEPFDGAQDRPNGAGGRFVTVRTASRIVALRFDEVLGVRTIASSAAAPIPPLLTGTMTDVCDAIGTLDHELLIVLKSGRLLPADTWASLDAGAGRT